MKVQQLRKSGELANATHSTHQSTSNAVFCCFQVKGLLNKEELVFAQSTTAFRGTHVVIATPACLAEALAPPEPLPFLAHAKALAIDEVDDCFEKDGEAMRAIMAAAAAGNRADGEVFDPVQA